MSADTPSRAAGDRGRSRLLAEAVERFKSLCTRGDLDLVDTEVTQSFIQRAEAALASSSSERGQEPQSEDEPSREYSVRICDQCYRLEGEMCHNPSCVFCRRTMREVGEYLDVLLIRPLVDGERLDLYGTESAAERGQARPAPDEGK